MEFENEWEVVHGHSRLDLARSSVLRLALLFGSAAVALALVAAPVLNRTVDGYIARADAGSVDMMTTGTIAARDVYTIHRSVLQSSPDAVCILRGNGAQSGDC